MLCRAQCSTGAALDKAGRLGHAGSHVGLSAFMQPDRQLVEGFQVLIDRRRCRSSRCKTQPRSADAAQKQMLSHPSICNSCCCVSAAEVQGRLRPTHRNGRQHVRGVE